MGFPFLFGIVVVAITWAWPRTPLLRPLGDWGIRSRLPLQTVTELRVLGYLPYWTVDSATISAQVNDVAYFAVSLGPDGEVVERSDGGLEPGFRRLSRPEWNRWLQERHVNGQKVHLVVTGSSAEDIVQLMITPLARQKAVNSLTQLAISYPLDGIHLDFELSGQQTDVVRAGYVTLTKDLRNSLDALGSRPQLSLAAFASAVNRPLLWDIPALSEHLDFIVVMAYDYHIRSSPSAGPVAPLFGREAGRWQNDIVGNIKEYLEYFPAEKVFLGIPLYGYEWQVTSPDPTANTFPGTGATATYERVMELLQDPAIKVKERWDADALSPYLIVEEKNSTTIIHYENTRSIAYKLDLVSQLKLGGIALWALGYEGPFPEVWELIDQRRK